MRRGTPVSNPVCACMVVLLHTVGWNERRARPIIRGAVVLLLCARSGELARASSLLVADGTVFFFLPQFPSPRINQRSAMFWSCLLQLMTTAAACSICRTARLCACSFGGRPVPFATPAGLHQNANYRARPCSVGEHDIKVLVYGPSAHENTCHDCLVKYLPRGRPTQVPTTMPVVEYAGGPGLIPVAMHANAAWKFSSSSHRAFDAVWNRLTHWAPR